MLFLLFSFFFDVLCIYAFVIFLVSFYYFFFFLFFFFLFCFFFFSSRRRHTRYIGDWSSDVCSSDLRPPRGRRGRRRLRGARAGDRPGTSDGARRAAAAPVGQPAAPRPHQPRRPGRNGRCCRRGRVRGRDAGPGVPRPGVGPGGPRRRRRRRAVHRHAVAARRSRPAGPEPRPAAREGEADARRRRRRLRRARGPLDADPRLHARAAHGPPGEDGLQPRGVVLRPRPSPPVPDALRARRHARRPPRLRARRIVLDGGAYASSSTAVCSNAACFAAGPYDVPNARIDAYVTYTNNPPCGAMRGFGAVQVAVGHEAQMDKLAAALGIDPVELRIRNAMRPGSLMPTGQVLPEPAPVAELLERLRAVPLPADAPSDPTHPLDLRELPGGVSNATHGEGVVRGVGYGVGFKNVGFSEGFDDYSTARVRLSLDGGEALVEVHTAAVEVGQGLVTVQAQIARTELGVERVAVLTADTSVGSAGSSSASRQTYVTGGAVKAACEALRERLHALAAERGVDRGDGPAAVLAEGEEIEETIEWHHRPTFALDGNGQGDAHLQFAFSAHRTVVDVDCELGLVRVVELATTQEVGKAMNPQALEGQIEGGSAQGLGLALLEEIQVQDGKVLNASFTDYLLPTILDMPPMRIEVLENADPEAPYGLKGVGEPPNISTPPAVMAALRDATGRDLRRVPVRPEHIVGIGSKPLTLPAINRLSEEAFVGAFGALFERSPWVARTAWGRRPFDSTADLHLAFEEAMRHADPELQLALIRAHPELAGREAEEGELTAESTR